MKTEWTVFVVVLAALLAGCKTTGEKTDGKRVLLTVDFEQGQTLRYKFVSNRDVFVDWDPNAASSENRVQKYTERLEMVVAYTPTEVDPYGVSTVRAVCEKVQAARAGRPSQRSVDTDAAESAEGKAFTLKVDPRGRLVDPSELEALIQATGEKAFRSETSRGRVKEPDLVGDFVAGPWFLWDCISSVEQPVEGVTLGQTWESKLPVPTPMVIRKARDVTYRLEEVRAADDGSLAVIASTYALADETPSDWPVPYSGRFQMSGTFGFLGGYQTLGIEGEGENLFDVDAGRMVKGAQRYKMEMKASLPPLGIQANPYVTIEQTLTVELMNP